MNKKTGISQILIIFGLSFQLIWEGILLSQYIVHSDTYKPTDFSIFYTAGRIAASGRYDLLYDIQTQQEVRESFLGQTIEATQVLPFNHPPILVPVLQLIVNGNYLATYWRWVAILAIFLGFAVLTLNKMLRELDWPVASRILFLFACIFFYPVFVSFLKGQDTAFFLFGASIWLYGVILEKDLPAGIGLGVMLIRPQIAIFLAIPFLFNRRKVFLWFSITGLVFALISVFMVRISGVKDYISLLLESAGGVNYEMFQAAMFNLTGLLMRIFPNVSIDAIHYFAWAAYILGMVGLSVWWKITSRLRFVHFAAAVCLGLVLSPHLHYHDLALLIIPISCLACANYQSKKNIRVQEWVLPIVISLVFLISDFWDPIRFSMPYLIMAAIPLITSKIENKNEKS